MDAVANWRARHWATAVAAGVLVLLAVGLPSDVIPNPVFGRPVEVTWWSYPVLVVTAVLGGLLVATYVTDPAPATADDEIDRPGKIGGLAGLLSFFAIGCPTCNKLVLIAVGSSGALDWFAPAQPLLAIASVVLLAWALRARLNSVGSCSIAAG